MGVFRAILCIFLRHGTWNGHDTRNVDETWNALAKEHVNDSAYWRMKVPLDCTVWRNRMKVPLKAVLDAIFESKDLSTIATLRCLGVNIAMSSRFGERITSGGLCALKKSNTRSSAKKVSISMFLHLNREFVQHAKQCYAQELQKEFDPWYFVF